MYMEEGFFYCRLPAFLLLRLAVRRIPFPSSRVVDYITPKAIRFRFIANDMFPKITLPDGRCNGLPAKSCCYADFHAADNGTDGTRRTRWALRRRVQG